MSSLANSKVNRSNTFQEPTYTIREGNGVASLVKHMPERWTCSRPIAIKIIDWYYPILIEAI